MTAMTRTLGRDGQLVSALGMGCWAIGGRWQMNGSQAGWGSVDDNESVRAVHAAIDAGITFFDTAANYGAGHSERVLGKALQGRRDQVAVATKFGYRVDEDAREVGAPEVGAAVVRPSCEASLRRLRTDRIDLFQLHVGDLSVDQALMVREALDALVADGLVAAYGWSVGDGRVEEARRFAEGAQACATLQQTLNVFQDAPEMLALCEEQGLASVNRSPLGMGMLTGKYQQGASFPGDDLRGGDVEWMPYFTDGQPDPQWSARLEAIREVLTSGGRTLTQGALSWIWARSPATLPIPGARTVAQAQENAGAMAFGPLTADEVAEVGRLLSGAQAVQ